MRVKNKVMMLLMALMLVVSGMGVSATSFAANTSDDPWSFSLGVKMTTMQHIVGRRKDNDSKNYIYWSSTYGGNLSKITISPFGANSAQGKAYPAGTKSGGERRYIMNQTGKYALTNFVYELGYKYARPGMLGNKGSGGAKGVWSPDCAGSYTVLQ